MMIDTIKEWGELTLVLIGVLAAMIAGLKKIYRSARWVEESHALTQKIAAELKPNGGNSMRDQIDQLRDDMRDNTRRTAALEVAVQALQESEAARANAA